jgi:hypothetical protein
MTNVEQRLITLFDNQRKDYLTLKYLKKNTQLKKILQLTPEMTNTEIKKKLLPHVENDIRIVNGYKGLYVTRKISDTDLIINRLRKKPDSLGNLKKNFPIQAKKLVKIVSQMVMSGKLCVEFTENYIIKLTINDKAPERKDQTLQDTVEIQPMSDRQKMKAAYDHVGSGRSFVRIHAMRDYLNWPRERFDQTLEQLTKELIIQLHFGDPSVLTEKQLNDSYVDDEGQVCITITWRHV